MSKPKRKTARKARRNGGSRSGSLRLFKSYMFTTKDPAIDELRTVMQDHYGPKLTRKQYKDVEVSGGPTAGTIRNWFEGDIKRPQNCTLEAAGRAIGMKRVWVKNTNGSGK